jgi:hypothetical protein
LYVSSDLRHQQAGRDASADFMIAWRHLYFGEAEAVADSFSCAQQ